MHCSQCHFVYPDNVQACPRCGTPAPTAFVDEEISAFPSQGQPAGYSQQSYAQYPQNTGYAQGYPDMQVPSQQQKSKVPLVLGIIFGALALIALACVLIFVVIKPFDRTDSDNDNSSNYPVLVSDKNENNAANDNQNNVQKPAQSSSTTSGDASSGFDTVLVQDETTNASGVAITGLGTCQDTDIVVPQSIKQSDGTLLPVLWDEGEGFSGMENVVSVTLPEGMTKLNVGFKNSPKLESVVIPTSIREIGLYIFENCPSLEKVTYLGTGEQWTCQRYRYRTDRNRAVLGKRWTSVCNRSSCSR